MPFDFAKIRESFFDTEKVMEAVRKAKKKSLGAQGAFIRQRARSSIRKSKKSALPGTPPKSHKGTLRLILFAWDAATESVVVGPVKAVSKDGRLVPPLLEFGGTATKLERVPRALGRRASERQAEAYKRKIKDGTITVPAREKRSKLAHYHEFPYMAPAELAGRADFEKKFHNSVR